MGRSCSAGPAADYCACRRMEDQSHLSRSSTRRAASSPMHGRSSFPTDDTISCTEKPRPRGQWHLRALDWIRTISDWCSRPRPCGLRADRPSALRAGRQSDDASVRRHHGDAHGRSDGSTRPCRRPWRALMAAAFGGPGHHCVLERGRTSDVRPAGGRSVGCAQFSRCCREASISSVDLSPDGARALLTERVDAQNDALSTIDLKTGLRQR